uniref:C-type lectin domain-containing protein n=1 Tax=Anas platyrhynchos TaxID=8839 RepID=A0A8B9SHV9_ANAPL
IGATISFCLFPARKCPSCPSPILPTCSENGIGFREKCFYFVQNETNWNKSQSFCLSLGAQLATIDSQEDLVKRGVCRVLGWLFGKQLWGSLEDVR